MRHTFGTSKLNANHKIISPFLSKNIFIASYISCSYLWLTNLCEGLTLKIHLPFQV